MADLRLLISACYYTYLQGKVEEVENLKHQLELTLTARSQRAQEIFAPLTAQTSASLFDTIMCWERSHT